MKFSSQKVQAISQLSGRERYSHFIKVAADLRSVHGLYLDGWALMQDSNGAQYFPVWPARAYAEQCAVLDWSSYRPREISLDEFMREYIPDLRGSNTGVAVFPAPGEKGVTPDLELLVGDLGSELSRIE
jgi:hypothetical protein